MHLLSMGGSSPLAVRYPQLTSLSTNVNCKRLMQQIPTCARPKPLLQSILGHRRPAVQGGFLIPSPVAFCSISKPAEQGCTSCKGPGVSLHPVPFSTATAIILLFTTSVAFPSPGSSDPSPPLMLLQVVLKAGLLSTMAGIFKDV